MDNSQVAIAEIYGGILIGIILIIIIFLMLNDVIRNRMYSACNRTLSSTQKIHRLSVDSRTAEYLKRYHHESLYRVNEYISKKDNIIRYRLCLRKRSFDFYLKKQNLWNYKVLAIQMY
jgi:hypothetical protein